MTYRYRAEVLEELLRHGVRPAPETPPALVRSFLNDLYRFEIRRERDRLLRREVLERSYAARIADLRDRYPLLSLQLRHWTIDA